MILIQYMNARDKFRYHSPHPQVMRYLGYRIGGKKGTRGGKNDNTGCISEWGFSGYV